MFQCSTSETEKENLSGKHFNVCSQFIIIKLGALGLEGLEGQTACGIVTISETR